jgi:hypothetical protein
MCDRCRREAAEEKALNGHTEEILVNGVVRR